MKRKLINQLYTKAVPGQSYSARHLLQSSLRGTMPSGITEKVTYYLPNDEVNLSIFDKEVFNPEFSVDNLSKLDDIREITRIYDERVKRKSEPPKPEPPKPEPPKQESLEL